MISILIPIERKIKGITHCYLPNCDRPTWPFENYCGRTHADLGKQMGLSRKYIIILYLYYHKYVRNYTQLTITNLL